MICVVLQGQIVYLSNEIKESYLQCPVTVLLFFRVHNIEGMRLPDTFDARQQWRNCPTIQQIRDQGSCGSCWVRLTKQVGTNRISTEITSAQLCSLSLISHRPLGLLRRYRTGCVSTAVRRSHWRSLLRICCPAVMNAGWGESSVQLNQWIPGGQLTTPVLLISCRCSCFGGFPSAAWEFWAKKGLVTGGLYGSKVGECEVKCVCTAQAF